MHNHRTVNAPVLHWKDKIDHNAFFIGLSSDLMVKQFTALWIIKWVWSPKLSSSYFERIESGHSILTSSNISNNLLCIYYTFMTVVERFVWLNNFVECKKSKLIFETTLILNEKIFQVRKMDLCMWKHTKTNWKPPFKDVNIINMPFYYLIFPVLKWLSLLLLPHALSQ